MSDKRLTAERAELLRSAVQNKYRAVASQPMRQFRYPVGRAGALGLGYESVWLDAVPTEVVERFVGIGNPFGIHRPRSADRVLDAGCGCGLDSLVSSVLVGERGRVIGVDLTQEMLSVGRAALDRWPLDNVEFSQSSVEKLAFETAFFDVVISNGVLNLVPDKVAAFRELSRVLRPGGIFVAADLLVDRAIPPEVLDDMDAWST